MTYVTLDDIWDNLSVTKIDIWKSKCFVSLLWKIKALIILCFNYHAIPLSYEGISFNDLLFNLKIYPLISIAFNQ